MAELEKNPHLIKQSAAAVVCVAAAATAMPAISHRAAEQRADAQWAARSAAFQRIVQAELQSGAFAGASSRTDVAAIGLPVQLASYSPSSYAVRGVAVAEESELDAMDAMRVRAGLRDQAAVGNFASFQPATLKASRMAAKEKRCLAEAIYYEARGESHVGQAAVAEVVLNRVRSGIYPNTVCEVVYQGSWRSTGCQFTFTCDGSLRHKPRGPAWRQANLLASQAMLGVSRSLTGRATHYHTTAVDPYWSASLVETTRIGAHIFYRFPNRRERAALVARNEAPEPVVIAPPTEAPSEIPMEDVATATPLQIAPSLS